MFKLTLKQCRYFVAVVKYGGLAQASRKINISQPAIAQAMDKVEAICGFKAFTRHHAKGFELTHKGRGLLLEIEKILDETDRADLVIKAIKNNELAKVRLGIFQSISPFYLAAILKKVKRNHPGISVETREDLHDQLTNALLDDEIDLAITYDLSPFRNDLKFKQIVKQRPYVILPESSVYARDDKISLRKLQNEKFVLFDAPGSREYFAGLFDQVGIDPEISLRSTSLESVRSAVGNEFGFSVLIMKPPRGICYDSSRIVELEIIDEIKPTFIGMTYKKSFDLEPVFQDFIDDCVSVISA